MSWNFIREAVAPSLVALTLAGASAQAQDRQYTRETLVNDVFTSGDYMQRTVGGITRDLYVARMHLQFPKKPLDPREKTLETVVVTIRVSDYGGDAQEFRDLAGKDGLSFYLNLGYCGDCTFTIGDNAPFFQYDVGQDQIDDNIPLATQRPDKTYDPKTAQALYDAVINAVLDARAKGAQFVPNGGKPKSASK